MNKFYCSLIFLSGLLGCVDTDYDLNNVTTDNVTIGDDSSEFRIPLVKVKVAVDDMKNNSGEIDEMFNEADVWLPKQLPDGDWVDLQKITTDAAYLTTLLDALTAQLMTDDAKMATVCAEVWRTQRSAYLQLLGLSGNSTITESEFLATFRTAFRSDATLRQQLGAQLRVNASDYLKTLRIDPLDYRIGRIDLSDEVVDMLAENLDKPNAATANNTLHIYGSITSQLPLSLGFTAYLDPTTVQLASSIDAIKGAGDIAETRLYEADLRQIISGATLRIPIALLRYYPGRDFNLEATHQIMIDLHLVKRGGLKIAL